MQEENRRIHWFTAVYVWLSIPLCSFKHSKCRRCFSCFEFILKKKRRLRLPPFPRIIFGGHCYAVRAARVDVWFTHKHSINPALLIKMSLCSPREQSRDPFTSSIFDFLLLCVVDAISEVVDSSRYVINTIHRGFSLIS